MMHLVLPPDYSEKRKAAITTLAERAAAYRATYEGRAFAERSAASRKGWQARRGNVA